MPLPSLRTCIDINSNFLILAGKIRTENTDKLYFYSFQKYPMLHFAVESEKRYPREIYWYITPRSFFVQGVVYGNFVPCFMSLKMYALKTKVVMRVAYLSCYKLWTLILTTKEFSPPKKKTIVFVDDSDNLPLWRLLSNESSRKHINAYSSS